MCDSMSVSFARMAARYREEARALESMRHVIGWNYCGFFVVKEGLAFTYLKASSRRMILMALAIYRELAEHYQSLPDATRIEYFYTPLPAAASSTATTATTSTAGSSPPSESSLPSGGGGGGGGGGEFTDEASIAELQDDCCVPLSLWCNNSFRMMIYRNSISEFHFQRYLFCRQFNVRFIETLVQKETKRDALTHHLSLCVVWCESSACCCSRNRSKQHDWRSISSKPWLERSWYIRQYVHPCFSKNGPSMRAPTLPKPRKRRCQ